jgi:hypothetical protein
MAWFVIFNHSIRSFEIIPVFSLFLFRGTPHRDTPGADLHDCRGASPQCDRKRASFFSKITESRLTLPADPPAEGWGREG